MRFQAPRGTEDVLPIEAERWLRLESTFREVTGQYGYGEIRTPTFEETALFTRTAGETSDIVSKEMYTFEDKGGRSITLKPEGTAPVVRAAIEHNLIPQGGHLRLRYVTPCFRYSRPQKGRLRELHQVGLELVGSTAAEADAEVIEVTVRFLETLGLTGLRVMLNSIGRDECREKFREAILAHMASFLADKDDVFQAQAAKNPLRLLDSKDGAVQAALEGLAPITDFLEEDSRARLDKVAQRLSEAGVEFELRPDVVRGLDYYTETVFEMQHSALGAQGSICGGGRYDNLISELGGPSVPSVGVGIGMERVLIAMEGENLHAPKSAPTGFVVSTEGAAFDYGLEVARVLRKAGLSIQNDIDGRSLKSQFRQADKSGAKFALVVGPEEVEKQVVQVKELATGTQVEVSLVELADRLKS